MQKSTWIKIGIVVLIFLVFLFLELRDPLYINDKFCQDCNTKSDCKDFCMKQCVPKLYDQVTATGRLNETLRCDCVCQTTLKVLLQ
jgi:hypothetical protein